jgi:hypothetical protein
MYITDRLLEPIINPHWKIAVPDEIKRRLCKPDWSVNGAKSLVTATISLLSSCLVTIWYARKCEKEADAQTIYALCMQERQDIVEDEIALLEDELAQTGDTNSLWFGSLSDRINYFKKILVEYY